MKFARTAIAGILLLLAASASAQQFPTVPSQSVIGRLGVPGQSGPSQAIPFATLGIGPMAPFTVKCNSTAVPAAPQDCSTAILGTGTSATTDITFGANHVVTTIVGEFGGHPFADNTSYNIPAGNYAASSFNAGSTVSGSANYDHFGAIQNGIAIKTSGTTLDLYGLVDIPSVWNGTLTNRHAVSVWDVTLVTGGVVTNNYGLHVKSLTAGINNFAIFTEGTTPSVLGGPLTLNGSTSGGTKLQVAAAASGTLTFPSATDTLVGKATTDVLTNKTFNTAGAGNVFQINNNTISSNTGTGSTNVLATNPTITNPAIVGTATNDNATAGNVGEYVESVIAQGSAVALTTGTAKDVTTISLTAGDWDVTAVGYFLPAASTSVTFTNLSISATLNTLDLTAGKFAQRIMAAVVPSPQVLTEVLMPYRLSLSATTTIHLVAQSAFTVSTESVFGVIRARRVR